MRLESGRLLATVAAVLTIAGASACAKGALDVSASPAPAAAPSDPKEACAAVMEAHGKARESFASASAALAHDKPTAVDVAKATQDIETALTAMHIVVATAAESTTAPQLKEKFAAYQRSVEQAIVVVEGSDGDKTKLASAIVLAELISAEEAVVSACAEAPSATTTSQRAAWPKSVHCYSSCTSSTLVLGAAAPSLSR